MPDRITPEQRSWNMSQVKGKDTKPEVMVRKYLFSHGFRYRKNDKRYPGKPDIVLPKYKTVIFVNGCFWHQHMSPSGSAECRISCKLQAASCKGQAASCKVQGVLLVLSDEL